MSMTIQGITDHLLALANPDIAKRSQVFFKTGKGEYAEGDKFLGIRVPIIRKAVKKYQAASFDTVEKLLYSEYHEIRLFALLVWTAQFPKASEIEQDIIYGLYLANTEYINNWDLVDTTCHHIIGQYLENKDRSTLHTLSTSTSLWERRISIVSTYHFIKNNDFDDALSISKQLLHDKEDLIHKAVGWMLREIGKRDKPKEIDFLNASYHTMPRTMLRYAIEKFNEEERQDYLKGRV